MAQQTINIGVVANDGTGDRPRTVGQKVNANFSELYSWARERVSSNRTYYVATTGSDSNTGLSPGVAWLTVQHAVDVIANTLTIDAGVDVIIQIANGTYTLTTSVLLRAYVGAGRVLINGNSGTPGSVIFTTSAATEFFLATNKSTPYFIDGMRIQATSGSPTAFLANGGAILFGNIEFNTGLGSHLLAKNGGVITASDDFSILAAVTVHMEANTQGAVVVDAVTVTITGTPGINTFAITRTLGYMSADGTTYTGSFTGKRYFAETNSVINTDGGGSTFFPGSVAGSTATGGQYV